MSTVTVNVSFQDTLLSAIDRVARGESRNRSELLREAAREYLERRNRWNDLFASGQALARRKRLKPDDVAAEIQAFRDGKGRRP